MFSYDYDHVHYEAWLLTDANPDYDVLMFSIDTALLLLFWLQSSIYHSFIFLLSSLSTATNVRVF